MNELERRDELENTLDELAEGLYILKPYLEFDRFSIPMYISKITYFHDIRGEALFDVNSALQLVEKSCDGRS